MGSSNDCPAIISLTSPTNPDTCDSDAANSLSICKRKRLFSTFSNEASLATKKTRSSVAEQIQDEISLFMKEPVDDYRRVFKRKEFYQFLHRLDVRVLCVPATSAPVERVFSSSGIIMRPHHGRLTKKMFAALTLLKCNQHLLQFLRFSSDRNFDEKNSHLSFHPHPQDIDIL